MTTRPTIGITALVVTVLLLAACGGSDDAEPASAADGPTTTASARSGDGGEGDDDEPGGSGEQGELFLLSYNVAGLPAEVSDEDPVTNLPLIGARLEPYDLVLTQEDFDWWQPALDSLDFVNYQQRLRADATHEYRSERHPGPEAVGLDWENDRPTLLVGDGLGFLSRLPMTDVQRVPWAGCFGGADGSDRGAGDCLAMKGFAVATVEITPDTTVHVYNLHAEAGATETDQQLQQEQYAQLAAFITEHSTGMPVVFAGDTNLHTSGEHPDANGDADAIIWQDFLQATGLVDVCTLVECDEPDAIDKAAVRSGGEVIFEVLERRYPREEFRDDAGEDLSDHPPLDVRIRWSVR